MNDNDAPPVLAWLDVETSGLDPVQDLLLEIGWRFTNLDYETLHERKWVVRHNFIDLGAARLGAIDKVRLMHEENGLWDECVDATSDRMWPTEIVLDMHDWLENTVKLADMPKLPISGSSIALDKSFLMHYFPTIGELFHYRVIDNSSIKELCKRYNPAVYAQLPEFETNHRVFTCLDGSIAESKFYTDNFLFDGRDYPREGE